MRTEVFTTVLHLACINDNGLGSPCRSAPIL